MPYPPTKTPIDCTDVHRLGGKTQPKDLWASVKSVGEYSSPVVSVGSANSVGEYVKLAFRRSVSSCRSVKVSPSTSTPNTNGASILPVIVAIVNGLCVQRDKTYWF